MKIIQNNLPLFECVKKLSNDKIQNIQKNYSDLIENPSLQNHIEQKFNEFTEAISKLTTSADFVKENPAGRINRDSQSHAGHFLYLLVRSLKPDVVVETGVSSGESSSYILQAIQDNNKGKLFSIDLPEVIVENEKKAILHPGKQPGWVIPEFLKKNWKLLLGSSVDLLLPLLKEIKTIDIFLHDSLHTYDHMMFEFSTSWDFIRLGGILVSDDVATMNGKGHSPFIDFAESKKENISVFGMMGGFRKTKS